MARPKKQEQVMTIEPLKETVMRIELVGDSDLVLNKKDRFFEQSEIWKQTHPKGAEPPTIYKRKVGVWEHLITSITWRDQIEFHDEKPELYTEQEWQNYMENNKPCILAVAFYRSFAEAFKTFYKPVIKKDGTDLQRALNLSSTIFPISFETVQVEQKLVPNTGMNKTNVVCNRNVFSGWSTEIELSCADIVFPYDTVLSIIQTAGKYIGIGTNRNYGYGRYHIGKVDVIG